MRRYLGQGFIERIASPESKSFSPSRGDLYPVLRICQICIGRSQQAIHPQLVKGLTRYGTVVFVKLTS
jgi:hypothetical protein